MSMLQYTSSETENTDVGAVGDWVTGAVGSMVGAGPPQYTVRWTSLPLVMERQLLALAAE